MRALKIKVRGLKKPQYQRLRELTAHSKNLYNQALWTLHEAFEATGQYFSYPMMDKAMKQVANLEGEVNYKLLKAKVAQQTLRRLDKNFKSFFQANKGFKKNPKKYKGKPKPPRYKSNPHDNLIYDYQAFRIKVINLIEYKQVALLEKGLDIKIPNQLWDKQIKQIEIIPKHHSFYAVFVYEQNPDDYKKVKPNHNIISIDLGSNNLATCVTNGVVKPFIIDGKRLKSINAFYNKRKAKMQSKLKKRNRKWSRSLQNLTNKRNRAVTDYLHKATSIVVQNCIEHDISKVVIGDLAKSLDKINLGKQTNQNFVNLALGQFIEKLKYKLGAHNIELCVIDESYTSKASFIDDDQMPKLYNPKSKNHYVFSGKRVKRGLYKSRNGTVINADVNGALNILRKAKSEFTFSFFAETIGTKVKEWLHPSKRFRPLPTHKDQFWIDLKHCYNKIQVT
jgi:putative transposase